MKTNMQRSFLCRIFRTRWLSLNDIDCQRLAVSLAMNESLLVPDLANIMMTTTTTFFCMHNVVLCVMCQK